MADNDEEGGRDERRHAGITRRNDDGRSSAEDAQREGEEARPGADIMHGRSFAGQNIANTEQGQTRDRERVVRGEALDEAGETVTDSEVEARISQRSERYED